MLALYGYGVFLSFGHLEGGYKADDFLAAVQCCVVPFLQPYDKANPRPSSILVLDNYRFCCSWVRVSPFFFLTWWH